jgi:DNA-binding XRE family transcriptional regulator
MSKQKVYNRLKLFRVSNNVSRETLAQALGVNVQTIGYIERGDYCPSLELGLRLSAYFNVPVETLFALKKFPPLGKKTII